MSRPLIVTLPPVISYAAAAVGHGRKADRRLACAGFADETEDLAFFEIEIDAMQDFDVMRFGIGRIDGGADLEATDFDQRLSHDWPLTELSGFGEQ